MGEQAVFNLPRKASPTSTIGTSGRASTVQYVGARSTIVKFAIVKVFESASIKVQFMVLVLRLNNSTPNEYNPGPWLVMAATLQLMVWSKSVFDQLVEPLLMSLFEPMVRRL